MALQIKVLSDEEMNHLFPKTSGYEAKTINDVYDDLADAIEILTKGEKSRKLKMKFEKAHSVVTLKYTRGTERCAFALPASSHAQATAVVTELLKCLRGRTCPAPVTAKLQSLLDDAKANMANRVRNRKTKA